MCCPFVGSSSPTSGRESWLKVLPVSGDPNRFRPATGKYVPSFSVHPMYQQNICWRRRDNYMPMQMTPHYWQLFESQQTDLLLLPPRDLARIREWCNNWCMILNPNKSKASAVNRSQTVKSPHGDLFLSVVSIPASPNLDILGVKFDSKLTFEGQVRFIVFRVSQRIGIFRLIKRIFVDTSVFLHCYYAFLSTYLEYFSQCGVSCRMTPSASRAPGVFSGQAFP